MCTFFNKILNEVKQKDQSIKLQSNEAIVDTTKEMISFLYEKLESMKRYVLSSNFNSLDDEIHFFKKIKPNIHSLLIFYKHVYNIEITRPIGNGKKSVIHYTDYLEKVSKSNKRYYRNNSFYQYMKSGRTDKDELYFLRYKDNDVIYTGNQSFTFIDFQFTTFYDSVLSLIIAEERLTFYIESKTSRSTTNDTSIQNLNWSNSKSSMIELIYALHISKSIPQSNIRKIASVFEQVFDIKLGDIHHTYHRMKYRTDSRTLFLDQLKHALESHLGQNDQ